MQKLGQYEAVVRVEDIQMGPVILKVILYGAYNALGLIGPEMNGIAIVEHTPRRCVLVDEIAKENYGWYNGYGSPSADQLAEFERICNLPDADLLLFIQNHPRYRGVPLVPLGAMG